MKKIRILFIFILFIAFSTDNVKAKDVYYTNGNGIQLTKDEYNFINNMFYEGYQNFLTMDDYNYIFTDRTVDGEINRVTYNPHLVIQPYASTHTTPSKKITISTSCNINCLVTINVVWLRSPKIRSYDVIGAYLKDTSLILKPITKVTSGSILNNSFELVNSSTGFGVSILLPSSGNDVIVTQSFRVEKGGTVYGSYQHAKKKISLANSKKYTISRNGYGGVFLFDNEYSSYYDAMGGVSINV